MCLICCGQIHTWRKWEDEAHMDQHDSLSGKVFNYVGSTTASFNETLFNYMEVTNWMIVLYKLFQGSIISYVS